MTAFIPGIVLGRRFYVEAVRPLLDTHFPGLPHAAAHLGTGSDVLGFDTEMSTDHDWGPSVALFLNAEDAGRSEKIKETLGRTLPHTFAGYPVGMEESPDEPGTLVMGQAETKPIRHRVTVTTVRAFAQKHLAWDGETPLEAADWLTFPSQKLREMTSGAVHHDDMGELTALREKLTWYPPDVWRYLLAAGWNRIGQEEHLMSRAGYVGDELGSALIGSRLARDLMTLGFLMERQYAPYAKWFGTAFRRLRCAEALTPALWRAQQAATWQEREAALGEAYLLLARQQNALGLAEPVSEELTSFFGRPFQVIYGGRFMDALLAALSDPDVKRIATRQVIGSIDQFSDSTDLRSSPDWRPILRRLYTD